MKLSQIEAPTLLLDAAQCRTNIRHMAEKAKKHRVTLDPHFKTHQSHQIGAWFREEGVDQITVSSVRMARYFQQTGWRNITLAFPANLRQIDQINALAGDVNLTLFVNGARTAHELEQNLEVEVGAYTEIDTGYQRTGIPHDHNEEIEQLIDLFRHSKMLTFKGFYTHAGHSYKATKPEEIAEIHSITLHRLNQLRKQVGVKHSNVRLSIGDTPASSTVNNFAGVESIHPGNFVFYDVNQYRISSCTPDQIAVALACPVVSRRPERKELILHGGAIHLSKQFERFKDNTPYYGLPVTLDESGWSEPWPNSYLRSLSQEHGILKCNSEKFEQYRVGDLVGILPIHSCLTCNLMGEYLTLDGASVDHMEKAAFE